jgi:hypothetical protein
MSTISPNMNLVVPTIAVDSGLVWEQSVNADLSILDGHNHSPGSGVQINPSGININSDLPFGGNNATLLRSVRLQPQGATLLSGASDIGCIYEAGSSGDLYYNDASGNKIQITKSGGVNATSSGISSGTASASFVSGVLVVDSAASTPANIQGASFLLGLNSAGTNYLTLSPPSSLSSGSYSLVFPAVPSVLSSMTLDNSGNMGTISFDQVGVNMTSTGANAIANSRTRSVGAIVGTGGVAISSSCGTVTNTSSTSVRATNLVVTLTTTGRPVWVGLVSDGSGVVSAAGVQEAGTDGGQCIINIHNETSGIYYACNITSYTISGSGNAYTSIPASSINVVDTSAPAGANSWEVRIQSSDGVSTAFLYNAKLVAYEL